MQVAWIKADTKAILAIHNRVITHNNRMNVIHSDHNTWQLKIRDVRRNDSGQYMCQINTDPMKMQVSLPGLQRVVAGPGCVHIRGWARISTERRGVCVGTAIEK